MLSLLKLLEIQAKTPEKSPQIQLTQNMKYFLIQTILGILYGVENKNQQLASKQFYFAEKIMKRNVLLFDLDETLITHNTDAQKSDFSFSCNLNQEIINFNISVRPYAQEILKQLSQFYEIIIFTASQNEYANKIIDYIDPTHDFISLILDREFCYQTSHGIFIKDLNLFQNFDKENTLIIDNSSLAYCFSPNNGVPILSWNGDKNDKELVVLAEYLMNLLQGEGSIVSKHQHQFSIKRLIDFYKGLQF